MAGAEPSKSAAGAACARCPPPMVSHPTTWRPGGRPRGGPGPGAAAGRGRRPPRGTRLLPTSPSGHLAGHAPPDRPRTADRPGDRSRGAGRQRGTGRCGWRPVPPHPVGAVPTVANAGHYARLVAETSRRRRVIDLGIQLAHSDADPAVLAHLAGELAATTAGTGKRGWTLPTPLGDGGEVPAFPIEALPGWLGEYVAAVATATQTPPDLAGMLALTVLATVSAGAVEVEPRAGWREPLCLFVAVGMDAEVAEGERLHRHDPPGGRLRTHPGRRRPSRDHRDRGPAPHRRPGRRHRRGRRRQGPSQPAGGTPGRGHRPGRRSGQSGRAADPAVAG